MANIVRYQPLNVRRGQQQPYPSLWDPISRLHQQMNELFDSNFSGLWDQEDSDRGMQFVPSLDVDQDETRYEITVELPGVAQEDITVDVQGDQLVIEGSKSEGTGEKQREKLQARRCYGAFRQQLTLPEDADESAISASFSNGVLSIMVPRDENKLAGKRRRIEVKSDGAGDSASGASSSRRALDNDSQEVTESTQSEQGG